MLTFPAPDAVYQELFIDIQESHIFPDSKTFVDCLPKANPVKILQDYLIARERPGFDLKAFVSAHFDLPTTPGTGFEADKSRPLNQHIELLWQLLKREADQAISGSSLIPLPHPYIVPGGRFGEIYYWDSYFTMLGLEVSGHWEMMENMVRNFAHLIHTIGYIPNGNRSYFLGRSQPPFFALMVELLSQKKGESILVEMLPVLEAEYQFWMAGCESLRPGEADRRVVCLADGTILNRYWDDRPIPRQESYREDVEDAAHSGREKTDFYRNIRAGCESGWDFSSRWFSDRKTLHTIQTTEILPIDLNSLLWNLEQTLENAHLTAGNLRKSQEYQEKATARKRAIQQKFWDMDMQAFADLGLDGTGSTGILSAACCFPLFFNLATPQQAKATMHSVKAHLLKPGGLGTTNIHSGQQWDAPNGWAPLQWIGIKGLRNYGFDELSDLIRDRWMELNERIYSNTGKMMEKYNVEDMGLQAGGGEYPVQDGFGWSNGVYLKLFSEKHPN